MTKATLVKMMVGTMMAVTVMTAGAGFGQVHAAANTAEKVYETRDKTVTVTTDENTGEYKSLIQFKDGREDVNYDGKIIVSDIHYVNETGAEITSIQLRQTGSDEWGENAISNGKTIEADKTLNCEKGFTYAAENPQWDVLVKTADGQICEFDNIDLSKAKNAEDITLTLANQDGNAKLFLD